MGSVKDLIILRNPDGGLGDGIFEFSNRYSVFDYGEMPDKIEGKGASLCLITAYFFEKIEEAGIKTHYVGLIVDDKVKKLEELESATNKMRVKLVRVLRPSGRDYSIFGKERANFLIPLEIIYRNKIPEGSSLLRRVASGEVKPEDFGLKEIKPNMRLERPIVDFSTKLEDIDRYLSHAEAKKIAALNDEEFEMLKEIVLRVDDIITSEVAKVGLENEDGKIELAFDEKRRFMVVDAVGTPDECRFSFEGFEVSKEFLRNYYRKTEWYEKMKVHKGKENWREIIGTPPKLDPEVKRAASELYMALCNEITGRKFFDVPKLSSVVKSLRAHL
jgi:phosphoribosylaminoimidazole-succinocarboxamide synthase